jgi:hypothetical protein
MHTDVLTRWMAAGDRVFHLDKVWVRLARRAIYVRSGFHYSCAVIDANDQDLKAKKRRVF